MKPRIVVNLADAWAWEDIEAPTGARASLLHMEDGSEVVLMVDPRNALGVTDDDKMAQARGSLFFALGGCGAIDGKLYRIEGPGASPFDGVPVLTLEQLESPESDIEYARRTRRNRNA